MSKADELKNKVLNGGRGSGQSLRLLIEVYENHIADLQHKVDTLQGFLDHDIEYDMDKTIQELRKENEEMKKGLGCETCQIHLEYMRLNDKIRELEQKLEQTEKDLADYQFNYPTIKELSKENAELKQDKKDLIFVRNAKTDHIIELKDQLTKAKDLLNEFMRISKASDEDFEHVYSELIVETEQFIKEIEK